MAAAVTGNAKKYSANLGDCLFLMRERQERACVSWNNDMLASGSASSQEDG